MLTPLSVPASHASFRRWKIQIRKWPGRGTRRMRAKGVVVDIGPGADEARRDPRRSHHARDAGRPHVDGQARDLRRRQGGAAGRKQASDHRARQARERRIPDARGQAMPYWSVSAPYLPDDPQLTCRLPGMFERSPVRVVLDEQLSLPLSTSVVATVRETPDLGIHIAQAVPDCRRNPSAKGCKVFRVDESDGRLDLQAGSRRRSPSKALRG